jgi:hypothetical protein
MLSPMLESVASVNWRGLLPGTQLTPNTKQRASFLQLPRKGAGKVRNDVMQKLYRGHVRRSSRGKAKAVRATGA